MKSKTEIEKFAKNVKLELTEMKKVGMSVPNKAIKMCDNLKLIKGYMNLSCSECADLLIDISF